MKKKTSELFFGPTQPRTRSISRPKKSSGVFFFAGGLR